METQTIPEDGLNQAKLVPRPATASVACLLGALVPGAGHAFQGRLGRGAFFLFALMTLFGVGLGLDARLAFHRGLDDPLALVMGVGQMAVGLPYVLARSLGYAAGEPTSPGFEYGLLFTTTAGLLNVLVVLDALDIALGRKS